MSRVVIAQIKQGPVVKAAEDQQAFNEWFREYGHKSYDRSELKVRSAEVFELEE